MTTPTLMSTPPKEKKKSFINKLYAIPYVKIVGVCADKPVKTNYFSLYHSHEPK